MKDRHWLAERCHGLQQEGPGAGGILLVSDAGAIAEHQHTARSAAYGEGPHYEDLLAAMEVRVTQGGREQYGAWREETHDDLVFAVALAYWSAQKAYPGEAEGDERWWRNTYQDDAERMFRKWKEKEKRNGHG
jgi:hypothetical protein